MASISRAASPQIVDEAPILVPEDSEATVATVAIPADRAEAASYLALLLFYLPLGFSGLMMTLDLPVVNAVLNRLPKPDTSVAPLRVAFSPAPLYEASHSSMIDASTPLPADLRILRMLRPFYLVTAGSLLLVASLV